MKSHVERLDRHLLSVQHCTALFVTAGAYREEHFWKAVGMKHELGHVVRSAVHCNASKSAIDFQWARTSRGSTILVGSWAEPPMPGTPPGMALKDLRTEMIESASNASFVGSCKSPPTCYTNAWQGRVDEYVSYVRGTAWYSYPMWCLDIIRRFSLILKVDIDANLFRPIAFNLLAEMEGKAFAHTAKNCQHADHSCSGGFSQAKAEYLKTTKLTPKSAGIWEFEENGDLYYTNFVVMNTSFFTSPPALHFARHLYNYPCGYLWQRWTDQIAFHNIMGLLLADFSSYVVDLSDLRCASSDKCFIAKPVDKCSQTALFVHQKGLHPVEDESHPYFNMRAKARTIRYKQFLHAAGGSGRGRCAVNGTWC